MAWKHFQNMLIACFFFETIEKTLTFIPSPLQMIAKAWALSFQCTRLLHRAEIHFVLFLFNAKKCTEGLAYPFHYRCRSSAFIFLLSSLSIILSSSSSSAAHTSPLLSTVFHQLKHFLRQTHQNCWLQKSATYSRMFLRFSEKCFLIIGIFHRPGMSAPYQFHFKFKFITTRSFYIKYIFKIPYRLEAKHPTRLRYTLQSVA